MKLACENPRLTQTPDAAALELDCSGTITSTPAWTSPVHDLAGNMTTIPRVSAPGTAQTTVYDAWNRLVELRQTTVIADYKYDGRGRRIFKSTSDESRDFYYSNAWQDLEERVSGAADTQYVWGLRYVDELICRDYDNDSDGTLEQRMYALQDANFNLTAIVDTNGDPQERYIYSPYGVRSFLTPFFASRSSSSYLWSIGHQGLMHDYESGLVYNRNRMLHPKLGRFMQRDPLGYVDGASMYEYVQSAPTKGSDPHGTSSLPGKPAPLPSQPITSCQLGYRISPLGHVTLVVITDQGWYTVDGQGPWGLGITIGWDHEPTSKPPGHVKMAPPPSVVFCYCLLGFNNRLEDFGKRLKCSKYNYSLFGTNSNWTLNCFMQSCGIRATWDNKPIGWEAVQCP